MNHLIARRRLLLGAGATLAAGVLPGCASMAGGRGASARLPPYLASVDRIIGITVCSRPFRAAGPRTELEKIGLQNVVHSYGHGGSGWSLSWGNGEVVARLALGTGEKDIGVVGCGAIGLTSAVQLQRAGAQVTIYARDLPPNVLSNFATGVWSPSSRIGLADALAPAFKTQWQSMTRASWRMYGSLLGLPGTPVEFYEGYGLRDTPPVAGPPRPRTDPRPAFAELDRELVPEIGTRSVAVDPAATSFAPRYIRKGYSLMFNLPAYSRMLMADFRAAGGRVVIDEFRSPADFARLPHKTLVNATGMGARALLGDQSVIPVRGQLAHMIPQADIRYGLQYKDVAMTPRRDGFVLQAHGDGDYFGYDIPTREPDMAEAQHAVSVIASAFR
ncbi:MAG: FAD-dependent oxidoreductase [Steroidobacteraceae bacterium]